MLHFSSSQCRIQRDLGDVEVECGVKKLWPGLSRVFSGSTNDLFDFGGNRAGSRALHTVGRKLIMTTLYSRLTKIFAYFRCALQINPRAAIRATRANRKTIYPPGFRLFPQAVRRRRMDWNRGRPLRYSAVTTAFAVAGAARRLSENSRNSMTRTTSAARRGEKSQRHDLGTTTACWPG